MRRQNKMPVPDVSDLRSELNREMYKYRFASVLRSTVSTLVVIAACAILVATLWLPVVQIYGSSMSPTLKEGQIVVSIKGSDFKQHDLVAFYIGNKLLVKRVIAGPGDVVNITEDGTVYVNNQELIEPYVTGKALGDCDIEFPYQVPESRIFVMGDHRSTSVDSRTVKVGCIAEEYIIGRLIFRLWPWEAIGVL